MDNPVVKKGSHLKPESTRRPGIRERRYLTPEESACHNVVLIDADQGAEVELHRIHNSESIFVLRGSFEVIFPDSSQTLEPGDLVYFPPESIHGLRCLKGPGRSLAVFAPAQKPPSTDWLHTSYVEAWKQYSHEDNLGQSRNNLYVAVQAVLIALLTGIAGILINLDPVPIGTQNLQMGIGILGIVAIVASTFALLFATSWANATRAAIGYIRARRAVMMAIEEEVGLRFPCGLQKMENRWKKASRENPNKQYYPFPDSDELRRFGIPPYEKVSGWSSLLSVIEVVKFLWFFIFMVGVALLGHVVVTYLRGC